ncbi:MAG: hypothetical protein VB036_17125, partial [Propionicimonas sp.]|nr:hypothetical protein [Propionicimonas sp.]
MRGVRGIGIGVLAAAIGLSGLTAAPAQADTGSSGAASATVADTVVTGTSIHLEGSGWVHPTDGGSVIGVKLDSQSIEPVAGPVTNPATGDPATGLGIWAAIGAEEDGSFSVDLDFPTPATTKPAIGEADWAVGTTHTLRLLTGSMKNGDTPRSVMLTFQVVAAPVEPTATATATTTATGANAGQVSVAVSGAGFTEGEKLTVSRDGTPLQWTSGRPATSYSEYTVGAAGTLSANVVFAPGVLRAGPLTLTITRSSDGAAPVEVSAAVIPGVSFGGGSTQGASGTLTLVALPADAVVSTVKVGDDTVAAGLTADSAGLATGDYTIPSDAALGTVPVVVSQTAPVAATYTSSVKVSPDPTTFGTDGFTITETADGAIEQGLYQSAYSAASDSLFVTTANVTTTSTIYKLDPQTLAVRASVVPAYVSGTSGAIWAAYGIGVDDVNGNVWVTNTRQNTVAVYRQSDLSLVKQFESGAVTHSRDVVYDAAHDRVYVSSANEGQSGDGYIAVFDAKTLEQLPNVAVHPRSEFNPVSLFLDKQSGKLWTVSLFHDKALWVDTNDPELPDTILTLPGLDVGGRGASGVAYDAGTNRLFVASQNNDELLVADASTGATIKEVPTGAGALNVDLDPVNRLAYVTNLSSASVTVTDFDGTKIANLPISKSNHVSVDGLGSAYVVNKDAGNKVYRITPKAAPEPEPVLTAATPTVSGKAQVGQKLTAVAGSWGPAPVSLAYQWLRNGKEITTATASSYVLTAADLGARIAVEVTGSKAGYPSVTKASATTAAVTAAAAPVAKVKPSISGTPAVGKTLTAKPGSWSLAGLTFSYQWLRDGKAISGATKPGYTVVSADVRAKLAVRVSAVRAGYATGTATSATVVAGKALTATPTPKVSGTAKVGKTLKLKAGSWKPSKVTLAYQWLRDGAAIKGATKASYKLVRADAGHQVSVRVTGSKSGYASVAKVSKAKAVAKYAATVKLTVPSTVKRSKQARVTVTVTAAVSKPT